MSVGSFLRSMGYEVAVGRKPSHIANCTLLVLPGVGAFGKAVSALQLEELSENIKLRHDKVLPILGICLGYQLLTQSSEEAPSDQGIGLISTKTIRLLEISRIGWQAAETLSPEFSKFEGIYYFNHSFTTYPGPGFETITTSLEGGYTAMATNQLTVGVQFHPEKSQKSGEGIFTSIETDGAAVGLVDSLTCPTVWLPTYSEYQAFYERL